MNVSFEYVAGAGEENTYYYYIGSSTPETLKSVSPAKPMLVTKKSNRRWLGIQGI